MLKYLICPIKFALPERQSKHEMYDIVIFRVLLLLLCILYHCSNLLTLRLRSKSGIVKRINIDRNSTISDLYDELCKVEKFSNQNSLEIQGKVCLPGRSMQHNITSIGSVLADGDIASIKIETLNPGQQRTSLSDRKTDSIRRHHNRGNSKERGIKKSLIDIEKHRESLIKIEREKANDTTVVRISDATERILQRIGTNGRGIAVLIGKRKEVIVLSKNNDNNRRRRRADIIRKKSYKETKEKQFIDIYAAIEVLYEQKDSYMVDQNFGMLEEQLASFDERTIALVERAGIIARNLDLEVVGCCIGTDRLGSANSISANNMEAEDSIKDLWSSLHVHIALQLQTLVADDINSPFVVISAERDSISSTVDTDKVNGNGKVVRRNKATFRFNQRKKGVRTGADIGGGLLLEAFRLSKQAKDLHSSGILTAQPLRMRTDDTTVTSGKRAKLSKDESPPPVNFIGEVNLNGTVRLQNAEESSKVSAWLLAVPLPITSLAALNMEMKKTVATNTEDRESLHMTHLFPTFSELQDNNSAGIARTYLKKLLSKVSSGPIDSELCQRFFDPQLLLYLSTVMQDSVFRSFCSYLLHSHAVDRDRLAPPSDVLIALQMISDSLQDS